MRTARKIKKRIKCLNFPHPWTWEEISKAQYFITTMTYILRVMKGCTPPPGAVQALDGTIRYHRKLIRDCIPCFTRKDFRRNFITKPS